MKILKKRKIKIQKEDFLPKEKDAIKGEDIHNKKRDESKTKNGLKFKIRQTLSKQKLTKYKINTNKILNSKSKNNKKEKQKSFSKEILKEKIYDNARNIYNENKFEDKPIKLVQSISKKMPLHNSNNCREKKIKKVLKLVRIWIKIINK